MDIGAHLAFQELISCTFNFYLWEYDKDMNLLKSSCPEERTFEMIFSMMNIKAIFGLRTKRQHADCFSNDLDMTWIAVFEKGTARSSISICWVPSLQMSIR